MVDTTTRTNNRFLQIAAIIGSATVVVCWVIMDYFGILDIQRMGMDAKDYCMRFINDEVQS